MSDVDQIKFSVEQAVLDLGVKIVFPVVKGLDNAGKKGSVRLKKPRLMKPFAIVGVQAKSFCRK